jgi:hypothetical protein
MTNFVFTCLFFLFMLAVFVAAICTMTHFWIGTIFAFAIMGVCAYGMHAINTTIYENKG